MAVQIIAEHEKTTKNFEKYTIDKDGNKYGITGVLYLPKSENKPRKSLKVQVSK